MPIRSSPAVIERVLPAYNQKKQVPPIVPKPVSRVKLVPSKELLPWMILDSKIYINEQYLKNLRLVRGGDNNIFFDLLYMSMLVYAIANYPEEAAAFLNQLIRHNTPEVVGGLNQPGYFDGMSKSGSSSIMRGTPQNEHVTPWPWFAEGKICSQANSFRTPDGSVDIDQGYKEALRRAENSPNFECSRERFVELCTECGQITFKQMEEAIIGLQLEADGIVSNLRRDPIAAQNNIKGLDFLIDGPNGETHLEVKAPVDSRIRVEEGNRSSVNKQGKPIGKKIHVQVNNWVNTDKLVTKPMSDDKVLVAVDLFNVSTADKNKMVSAIQTGANNRAVS